MGKPGCRKGHERHRINTIRAQESGRVGGILPLVVCLAFDPAHPHTKIFHKSSFHNLGQRVSRVVRSPGGHQSRQTAFTVQSRCEAKAPQGQAIHLIAAELQHRPPQADLQHHDSAPFRFDGADIYRTQRPDLERALGRPPPLSRPTENCGHCFEQR